MLTAMIPSDWDGDEAGQDGVVIPATSGSSNAGSMEKTREVRRMAEFWKMKAEADSRRSWQRSWRMGMFSTG